MAGCRPQQQTSSGVSSQQEKNQRSSHQGHVGRPEVPTLGSFTLLERPEVELEALALREEDVHSVLGVSNGRKQNRLTSPATPAAGKSAVLDGLNGWGFPQNAELEDQEERLKDVLQQASLGELRGQRDGTADEVCPISTRPLSTEQISLAGHVEMPCPRIVSPENDDLEKPLDESRKVSPQSRSRAATGPIRSLADRNVKRFLSTFSFSEPKFFREFSRQRLSPRLSISRGPENAAPQVQGRPVRPKAYSISGSPLIRAEYSRSRDASPSSNQAATQGGMTLNSSASHTSIRSGMASPPSTPSRASYLRRSHSDPALSLQLSRSIVSSLGDDSRWDNISGQVNSRMKALKDSFQDANLKMPSMPSMPSMPNINFAALRPEFTYRKGSGDSKQIARSGAISTVYEKRDNSNKRASQSSLPKPSKHHHLHQALKDLKGDIMILGGYRGSILRSAEPPYRQLWVPVKVGLNIRKVNLEVGLEPEDEENMENDIFSNGMLTHIGPVDISRRLIRRLKNCTNAQEGLLRVHDYGYDWRLSPQLLSRKLLKFVKYLPCNSPTVPANERGVIVIAHSLGGLLVRHAVNQRPDLFGGVVYAGVPQHCVNILGPLRNGDEVLLSSKVLTAQVNFTLRTSFTLLPESGQCFIDKETNEEYPVDFFDVESWKKYAFSPCIASCLPSVSPDRRSIFGTNLPLLPSMRWPGNSTKVASDIVGKAENALNPETPHMFNRQSPSISFSSSSIPIQDALIYLERTLAETLAFKRSLAWNASHAAQNAYPPLAIIYATNTPTVYAAKVLGRDGIARADAFDNLAFASGDGVVLARSAMLPKGYKAAEGGRVRTDRGHVGLLGDVNAVGRSLMSVMKARREGVGLGCG